MKKSGSSIMKAAQPSSIQFSIDMETLAAPNRAPLVCRSTFVLARLDSWATPPI